MYLATLSRLRCPRCPRTRGGELIAPGADTAQDLIEGTITCSSCQARYPILAGVAILVPDVGAYFEQHARGIAALVPDSQIPAEYRKAFRQARAEIPTQHIDEDLESQRVTALYVMNHYLRASPDGGERPAWMPSPELANPLFDALIRAHWNQGPFAQIESWLAQLDPLPAMIELGCGVGGLCTRLSKQLGSYLGIDSSFASIALARHLSLGAPYPQPIRVPEDLLNGPVPKALEARELRHSEAPGLAFDFVVGEIDELPARTKQHDLAVALNAIDMLDDPEALPRLQHELLRAGGHAIQGAPYVWHPTIAAELRAKLPKYVRASAQAIEWLYEKNGLRIEQRVGHVPWLFFKHARQLEIYSVHLFLARSKLLH